MAQWPGLHLPNLATLMKRLAPGDKDDGSRQSLTPPHERALAVALGLCRPGTVPDGRVPWGAWHAALAGLAVAPEDAWAVITPCHWAVQTNHITMVHPRALNLMDEESRALLAAMLPYFTGSGIELVYDTATRWLARGAVFAGLATASPYRVVGARVDDWIPKGQAARELRRLQQEMQMLLYTHALSDARTARGALPVNSFWASGTGVLAPGQGAPVASGTSPDELVVVNTLRDAAVRDDWPAWAQAWRAIDVTHCRDLLTRLDSGQAIRLTLCGEQAAWTWGPGRSGPWQRLRSFLPGVFGHQPLSNVLEQL